MFYLDDRGNRVYTLKVRAFVQTGKIQLALSPAFPPMAHRPLFPFHCLAQKVDPNGVPTQSAHPARFSPDDKFSRERITCKKRFGILPTQVKEPALPLRPNARLISCFCWRSNSSHCLVSPAIALDVWIAQQAPVPY